MSGWLGWRLVKLIAVSLFAAGVVGAVADVDRRHRVAAAYHLLIPGFFGAWLAGQALRQLTERGLEPWLLAGMCSTWLSFHLAMTASHQPTPRRAGRVLALAALFFGVALMVARPTSWGGVAPLVALAAATGAVVHAAVGGEPGPHGPADLRGARRGLRAIAWAEGGSFLVMLLISMPARRLLGVSVDGGTGLLAWGHGVLVIAYLQALWTTGRALGWDGRTLGLGVVAAVVPFGPMLFDHHVDADAAAVSP